MLLCRHRNFIAVRHTRCTTFGGWKKLGMKLRTLSESGDRMPRREGKEGGWAHLGCGQYHLVRAMVVVIVRTKNISLMLEIPRTPVLLHYLRHHHQPAHSPHLLGYYLSPSRRPPGLGERKVELDTSVVSLQIGTRATGRTSRRDLPCLVSPAAQVCPGRSGRGIST